MRRDDNSDSADEEGQSDLAAVLWNTDETTCTGETTAQPAPERSCREEPLVMMQRLARERREVRDALDRAAQASFPNDSLSRRNLQTLGAALCDRNFKALEEQIKNSNPQNLQVLVQELNRNLQQIPRGRDLQISCTIRQMPTLSGLDAQGEPVFTGREVAFVLIGARNDQSRVISIPQLGPSKILRSSPGPDGQRGLRQSGEEEDWYFRLIVTNAINGLHRAPQR
ncbi:MAG: hypothetical protein K2W95_05770 [Candidatus Obscuribacterales bacterium]|nr:hypothetical protein [Candidatus Obscuribacterales bacterium]